jgi:hypothetical protein
MCGWGEKIIFTKKWLPYYKTQSSEFINKTRAVSDEFCPLLGLLLTYLGFSIRYSSFIRPNTKY